MTPLDDVPSEPFIDVVLFSWEGRSDVELRLLFREETAHRAGQAVRECVAKWLDKADRVKQLDRRIAGALEAATRRDGQ